MTIAKTMTALDLKLTAPDRLDARGAPGLGRLLRAAQRGLPRGQARGQRPRALEVSARTCTITWAASRPWTRASGGCSSSSTMKGWPATRSSSTRPTRASISASTAGSTSAGSSRNRCGRPCWCAGRASSSPGARPRASSRTSTSPRRFSMRPACRSQRTCRAEASFRS